MTHTFKLARRIARLKTQAARVAGSAPAALPHALLRPSHLLAATLLVLVAAGCTDNDITDISSASRAENTLELRRAGSGKGGRKPVSLIVSPDTARLAPAQSAQFTAKTLRRDGSLVTVAVQWSATGGSIDSTGKFVAGGTVGDYRVVARQSSGDLSDTAWVAVSGTAPAPGPAPEALVLTPQSASVQVGAKAVFTASVKLSDGSSGTGPVTYLGTGGTIDSSGTYTAGGTPGTYRVIARLDATGLADTSSVTVTASATTCTGSATVICPGDSWQGKVNAAGTGAMFTIRAGVHRLQTVVAKQGQQFLAESGAIMSGAKLLTAWVPNGSTWYVTGQTQEFGHSTGVCRSGTACQYPEDVYRDDVLLRRVLSLSAVGPGTFYFDYGADRIYVGDDPTGHRLEAAATEYAFLGSPDGAGTGVVIDGLTIEKYANAAQYGAVGRSNTQRGWVIRNCTIRWNHGAGIRTGAIQVRGCRIHHNGQIGMVGGGDATTLIRDNQVDHNNTLGFAPDWEGGGIKFGGGLFTGVQARHNQIHDNDGIGLWFDGYGDQFVFDSNTVARNTWDGIKVEISYSGRVTNNVITGNGFANPNSSEGDGIMVYSAGGTGLEISGNVLSGNKHAIMLFSADRGSGPLGPLVTKNVNVHDNTVTLSGSQRTGAVRYNGSSGLWTTDNNRFERNTYHLGSAAAAPFIWTNNVLLTETQWRSAGNDDTGAFTR